MVGMHGRGVVRTLATVCVGASLLAGGWSSAMAPGSTAAIASGGGPHASAPMFLRASRNRPSPGFQFGLSKAEQDYIYGPRDISTSSRPGLHGPRGPFPS